MSTTTQTELLDEIRRLGPWHQNLRLTDDVAIGSAYGTEAMAPGENQGVAFINSRDHYLARLRRIFPDGMAGLSVLDFGCNSGGFCFWAKELGAATTTGIDVRQHWIDQANFVKHNRTIAPTDGMRFVVGDLMDLPKLGIEPANFTVFQGIFYHLADPIAGLKIAADWTKDVLWFNSAIRPGPDEDCLRCSFESKSQLMSGVHSLSWFPTGAKVIAQMLTWLGFVDIRRATVHANEANAPLPRVEIYAARREGVLNGLDHSGLAQRIFKDGFPQPQ
jgi:SAM-dependent methyltransferase